MATESLDLRGGSPVRTIKLEKVRFADAESFALRILLGFLIIQTVCQVALMIPELGAARVVFRTAAYIGSFILLCFLPGRSLKTPWQNWLFAALGILCLNTFHPTGNTPLAVIAAILLNLSIAAPAFWVTRLFVTRKVMNYVLLLLWGYSTLSASAGVAQVLFPGLIDVQISSVVLAQGAIADGLKITLTDGSQIWRPTGLTDAPGGAAPAGMTAVLFSIGMLMSSRNKYLLMFSVISIGIGLFCIYVCQIRMVLVVLTIIVIAIIMGLMILNRYRTLSYMLTVIPILFIATFVIASQYGGDSMINRLESLTAEDPGKVYGKNRGLFLESTYDQMFDTYPFGAGLGRWSMVNTYFGVQEDTLWAEIQWTAWMYDGGVPLMFCYLMAMIAALLFSVKITLNSNKLRDDWLTSWALLISGYNVGTLALTFSYAPFIGQAGLEYWLLNAVLLAVSRVAQSPIQRVGAPS